MKFDKVSKKLATNCTPQLAQEQQNVTKSTDPITKKVTLAAPAGYNANANDDIHVCGAQTPFFDTISASKNSDGSYTIAASFSPGDASRPIQSVTINYNGQSYNATNNGSAWTTMVQGSSGTVDISAAAVDSQYYSTDSGVQKVSLQ
jgi:penicillin-binding protein 1A